MSNFPENIPTENPEEFENSTIFSDPTAHKNVVIKPKKPWKKIVAAVLSVAILISGTVAVINLIPVLKDDETVSSAFEEITVKSLNSDDVKTVTITNGKSTTEFYSKTDKDGDTPITSWYVKSLDKELVDTSAITAVVQSVSSFKATREITEKTAAECGLENPKIKANVVTDKKDSYTVLLGDISPDKSGYYCKLENSDKIYIVSGEMWESLNFDLLDFASTDSMSTFADNGENTEYFSNGTLSSFDKLVVTGKKFPEQVIIEKSNDKNISDYMPYVVTSPSDRMADNLESVMTLFQKGVSVSGAYSYDTKPETLQKFGLSNPDLAFEMSVGKENISYKFALQEDGNYAAIHNDSKLVHKVDASVLEGVINLNTNSFYSSWVCYTFIGDLSEFSITADGKEYSFGIVNNEENASSESDEEQEDYTITFNGKKISTEEFKNLYHYCISLKCLDFVTENLSDKPNVTLKFTHTNGKKDIFEFIKVSATKYQYTKNGIAMGRVSVTSIDTLVENAIKLSSGEKVGEIY